MHSHTFDETSTSRPPRWLVVAAVVILAQLIVSIGVDLQSSDVSRVALGILLVGLLLWGSRVAWVIIFLGVLYQIGSSVDSAQWRLVTGAVITLCLFAPSSTRYVWMTPVEQKSGWMGHRALGMYLRIRTSAYAITNWFVGWNDGEGEQELRRRSYRVGLWRFGLACLVLLLLGGVTVNWQESTGGDSTLLNIVENVIWICYVLAQLAFIVLVVLAVGSILARRRPQGQQ